MRGPVDVSHLPSPLPPEAFYYSTIKYEKIKKEGGSSFVQFFFVQHGLR